jgi:hypothetical protein
MRRSLKLYVKSAGPAITEVIEPRTMTGPCGAENRGLDVRPKVLDHQTWAKMRQLGVCEEFW